MKHSHEKKKMILKDTPSPSNIEQHIFFCRFHFSQRKRKIRLQLTMELFLLGAQMFTYLKADLCQEINGGFVFIRCLIYWYIFLEEVQR